jgi:large subunit ribosomal protein L4
MPKIALRTQAGGDAGSLDLDDAIFGIEPNTDVMHQVVTAQLAAARAGTQSTKTRAEVRGGGAKPWRQKGTGRARQGSIRSPQWRGGGVALGPKPRSYSQRTPKKMKRLALRSALSDRAAQDRVVVIDEWTFEAPRTKDAIAALSSLGVDGRILLVLADGDADVAKSFRNLQHVHVMRASELNTYDVLVSDWVVFSKETVPVQGAAVETSAQQTPVVEDEAPSEDAPVVEDETPAEEAPVAAEPAPESDEEDA